MEYFTKYLPLPKKFEGGDKFIDKSGTVRVFERADYLNLDKGVLWIDQNMWPHYANECIGPVKLFLCSRNINVGEQFSTLVGKRLCDGLIKEDLGDQWLVDSSFTGVKIKKQEVFKIIGEVSKAATWVTESMEFKEDEVQIRDLYNEHGHSSNMKKVVVFIKCSKSGKFH